MPMNQSVDCSSIARPGADSEPLSAQQRRFWVLDQLEHADAPHNVPSCLEIRGKLDLTVLERALRAVLERHDILRSRFVLENDEPRAVPDSSGFPSLPVVSLTQMPQTERKQAASALAAKELHRAFDLQAGPLFRATLYHLSDTEHLLALTFHKIVCDSVSSLVVTKEIAVSYDCIVRNTPLPPPGPKYLDYVRSQGDYLCGSQYDRDLAYWKNKLENVPAGVELPADRPRPLVLSFHGAEQFTVITGEPLAALRTFTRAEQSSTFLALLSAFICVLARYTGGEDIVIGTEVSGRNDPEMANVLGAVSNQLVLRADCSGDPNFRYMLRRMSQLWAEAEQHQSLPFGTLLDTLRVRRDAGRNPVFQVSFSREVAAERIDIADLHWEPVRLDTETAILDLSVNVIESDQDIEMRFSYRTDLFEHATIARMVGHFQTLLQAAVGDPEHPVSRLPLLTAAERHRLLVEWNDIAAEYTPTKCIHQMVEAQSGQTPHAIAVVCENQSLTYGELNQRANKLAHHLRRRGVGPEIVVAMCMERSLEMIVGILGVLKAGGAYLPLDLSYPPDRLAFMMEDANPPVVLTQESLRERLPEHGAQIICLDRDWEGIAQESAENLTDGASPSNLAYVIYTSGSTGKPKGCLITHYNVVRLFQATWNWYKFDDLDVWTMFHSYAFDFSVWEIWGALFYGGRVVIVPYLVSRSPEAFYRLLHDEGVTVLNQTPSAFRQLIQAEESVGVHDLALRYVIFGGEALEMQSLKPWYERHGDKKPLLVNMYGITETTVHVTYRPLSMTDTAGGSVIGSPIPDLQLYIVDQHRQPVPIGVAGEMYVGGAGVARGYLGRPELTSERFIPDPFSSRPGARLYKTGDLARFLPDGDVEYLGRIDHQVKIRGFRIELGEIESALTQHPAIRQAVVVVREDTPGDKRLVAYLVTDGEDPDIRELRAYLAKSLPEYMVPTGVSILSTLPLTPSGKVDRKALPAPVPERRDRFDLIPPRNHTETILASLFQKILNVDSVSIRDDFFDLGGHSVMAARLVSQIRAETGRQFPLAALFRAATVESLARLIEQEPEIGSDPVVMQIQRGDSARLPFFVIVPPGEESLGYAMLARHMGKEQPVYKIQGHAPVTNSKRPYSEQEMRDLTNEYIAAMRSVQPSGPYCLGGECDGTHISEQIVLSLEAQGEEVGLFAIFDTWVLQHSQRRWLWRIDYYSQRLQEFRGLNFTERLAAYARLAGNRFQTLVGKKPARADWPNTYWPEDFIPSQFRAPVILFKRPKQPFFYVKDPQMGWGARSQSGVEIHEVEFSHLEILREPHVRIFGEKLAERMLRLNQRTLSPLSMPESSEPARLITSIQQSQCGS